jgi:histidinol-phosphate aminotransferase
MLDVKRPAKEVIAAMAAQNVFIGRPWPVWPTHVRITVGTQSEMEKFQATFASVMKNPSAALHLASPLNISNNLDGLRIPERA